MSARAWVAFLFILTRIEPLVHAYTRRGHVARALLTISTPSTDTSFIFFIESRRLLHASSLAHAHFEKNTARVCHSICPSFPLCIKSRFIGRFPWKIRGKLYNLQRSRVKDENFFPFSVSFGHECNDVTINLSRMKDRCGFFRGIICYASEEVFMKGDQFTEGYLNTTIDFSELILNCHHRVITIGSCNNSRLIHLEFWNFSLD